MIWTTEYLNQLDTDAGNQISTDLNCIFQRSMFEITEGISVYTLPSVVRSLMRVTWRGKKVDPVNWQQFTQLTPNSVFLTNTNKIEASQSRPYFYTIHPTNLYDIRFYPTPNETFVVDGDPYSPLPNDPKCILSYYQIIDTASAITSLPTYIDRRIRKAYVLWQAFLGEGKGQSLRAAEYYRMKYFFLLERFRAINQGCYVSKAYTLEDDIVLTTPYRYPRPVLPPRFERRY